MIRERSEPRRLGRNAAASATGRAAQVIGASGHAYTPLVEDRERVVDEVGGAEVALRRPSRLR
jgi:hypothetical protein